VPEAYAILALDKLHVSAPIELLTGSMGANDSNGELLADTNSPLQLNAQEGVIAANKVRLQQPSTCAALFANIPQGAVQECGAVPSQDIPKPQPPLIRDLVSSAICDPPDALRECTPSARVTVGAGTERSSRPVATATSRSAAPSRSKAATTPSATSTRTTEAR